MTLPETQYARSGDAWIAYQVVGDAPTDLLMTLTAAFPMDTHYEEPHLASFLERLASFCRLIRFDKRGAGMSDPLTSTDPPTLDQWVLDGLAVLDAVGSEQTSLLAVDGAGGQVSMLFAATQPSRVKSVVLINPNPSPIQKDDWPWGRPPEDVPRVLDRVEQDFITGEDHGHDSLDERYRAWARRASRRGGGPSFQRSLFRIWIESDLRAVLPTIRAPVLVVSRPAPWRVPDSVEASRKTAECIPQARLVEMPGAPGAAFLGNVDPLLDEIEAFITGVRPAVRPDERVFATLLFTDIVSSTERTATLGDRGWRHVMDAHDSFVRRELDRFRGRLVNSTGDGLLAAFDGPARAVRCAQVIARGLRSAGLEIRAGLHAGEVEQRGNDVLGIAVNIASRVANLAQGGEILVSRTVTDLVAGSGLEFEDRGEHELKGVPGRWQLYAVRS